MASGPAWPIARTSACAGSESGRWQCPVTSVTTVPAQDSLVGLSIPDTSAERSDDDLGSVAQINDRAVGPLEVQPGESFPRQAPIGGPPR
jgi:hypothetical protein